jgi:hypothetical protein
MPFVFLLWYVYVRRHILQPWRVEDFDVAARCLYRVNTFQDSSLVCDAGAADPSMGDRNSSVSSRSSYQSRLWHIRIHRAKRSDIF